MSCLHIKINKVNDNISLKPSLESYLKISILSLNTPNIIYVEDTSQRLNVRYDLILEEE